MRRFHTAPAAVAVFAGLVLGCLSCGTKTPEYARPESFIVDPATGTYYVSNINLAKPDATKLSREDNNGYITLVNSKLEVLKHKFIEGGRDDVQLNDPKGMAIAGTTLWVADINTLRGFDTTTGKSVATVPLKKLGAISLNGVAAGPEGVIFVSDFQKNKIFRIDTADGNAASVLAEGNQLNNPNGLYWDPGEQLLYVACWKGGAVLTIDAEGAVGTFLSDPEQFSNLDGIDRDSVGNFYVSDYHNNAVYRISPELRVTALPVKVTTPADLSLDFKGELSATLDGLIRADELER